jgi:hypothetical protein
MTWGYLPEPVWHVLAELSFFFHQFCAMELSRDICLKLEKAAPLLLCKLEMIFPPGFFLSMQHMILHLPHEAQMGGPVQARWCYPIERCLKLLRKKCRNKAKIEASVVEAFVLEEVSTFTQAYYTENFPVCTIQPLVTTSTRTHRTSAFSKGISEEEAQVPTKT